jgi:hypothetical protein
VDLFEYLAAAFTLVLSFAVVRLVGGLPSALVPDRRYWVHVLLLVTVLSMVASIFWSLWSFREVSWNYPAFLLVLMQPALVYFLAATIVPDSPSAVKSWKTHYDFVRPRFFVGWICLAALTGTIEVAVLKMPFLDLGRVPALCGLVIGLVGFVSTSSKVHAGLVLIMSLMMIVSIFGTLFEPGSLAR